jgi:DNA modification methylase/ParB-like chromosome segregation protein Spo0J
MDRLGFLPQHPLVVTSDGNGGYELIDGNHRLEAALALGITDLPVHIVATPLSDNDKKKMARQANEAAETMIPTTFVDDAEFVWKEAENGKTQAEIAEMLGWGLSKVKNYSALSGICSQAWDIIVTSILKSCDLQEEEDVTKKVTTVTFSEGLLRSILDLTPDQQTALVTELVTNKDFSKNKFKAQAENHLARNQMKAYALQQLGELGEEYTKKLVDEIDSGAYDADWKNTDHPKLSRLITGLREEWEKKNSIHLVHGDFYEEVVKVGDGSIDLIITDPPYNIARDNEFEYEGRSNVSQDFGEWDKFTDEQFIAFFSTWAREWARVLRDQGSGYVFTSDSYISHLRSALTDAGLHVKATIVWHKKNPGTQAVKTNFKSSVEYILFFTKGKGGHTFNWKGKDEDEDEGDMHNFIETAICAGKERLKDGKGNTLHPTQKPERILKHFMEISSNRGDMVFDGFMGVGSSGAVAKSLGRKFIGIEQDKTYFDAAQRRLAE